MNSESGAVKEVLDVLFSHLEKLETETEAIKQFLKEKKKVTDAQLAPYLEQAGKASNVRWRAARVRIEYLLAGAEREANREAEKKPEIADDNSEARESDKTEASGTEIRAKEPERNEQKAAKEADARTAQQPAETKNTETAVVNGESSRQETNIRPEQTPEAVDTKETSDSSVKDPKREQEAA